MLGEIFSKLFKNSLIQINCITRSIIIMSDSPPPVKKSKISKKASSSGAAKSTATTGVSSLDFINKFELDRANTADSIIDFDFCKKRIKILSELENVKDSSNGIVYWMFRDSRVQDNWAFLYAQKLAIKNEVPLHVCFCLLPKFLDATIRHYKFLIGGLQQVKRECQQLNIQFHLLLGYGSEEIPKFVKAQNIGAVVCDFFPLRLPMKWVDEVKEKLPKSVPFAQVDAHNIVPVWVTSDKQEYAARTIRNKINSKLDLYLQQFPPLIKHKYSSKTKCSQVDWEKAIASLEVDMEVEEVDWAKPGYENGIKELENFCEKNLKKFNDKRNDPVCSALSNLSPWFHFGQVSVQRCILAVQKYKARCAEGVAVFCEEAIVRRELSDNFCFYNENYDSIEGLSKWAHDTLIEHKKDKREWLYTRQQLETAKTHDDLWNAAQIQMTKEGKMHGFLRMYWAKKILEWTKSPEEALAISIYLNDKYSLDGRDPNGYVGCMWSIGGIHDQGWKERPVFGKIRYMNYNGCKRKFDVPAFVARYGGKVYSTGSSGK